MNTMKRIAMPALAAMVLSAVQAQEADDGHYEGEYRDGKYPRL